MLALNPPSATQVSQPAPNRDDSNVIEVVGTRAEGQKIDRRTYMVRETPNSAQADTLQLLRGLPAVTISPNDQIMLLGAPHVTIMVDGRPVHTRNVSQYLRTLHGRDIERIEVITNPSAQYSAEGTGGIINIILRKKRNDGASGSVSAEGSTLGRGEASGSAKIKQGKWILDLQLQGDDGRTFRSTYHKLRRTESRPGGEPTINTEDGAGSSYNQTVSFNGKLTYEMDSKTSLSAEAFGGASSDWAGNSASFRGVTPDFQSFLERQRTRDTAPSIGGDIAVDHKGSRRGETFAATLRVNGNPEQTQLNAIDLSNGGAFSTARRNRLFSAQAQADWAHPIGKKEILSAGGQWYLQNSDRQYSFVGSGVPSLSFQTQDAFRVVECRASAYVTFQQGIGTWTVMPGLRLEQDSRHISSPGDADLRINRADIFPTFHAEHAFGRSIDLTLSYSRRIDRPELEQLQPYGVVMDPLTIQAGNPRLQDQSTDSYEVNLHYRHKNLEAGVIAYDRETNHLWSDTYLVNSSGMNLVTPINAGRRSDRGAEFDVNSPLLWRVKLTGSLNLFDSRVPIAPGSGSAISETFRVTTNTTLEWDGPSHGARPGDVVQVQLTYESPSRAFEVRDRGYFLPVLTATHSLSPTLSLTATLQGIRPLHFHHSLSAPLVQEQDDLRQTLPEFMVKLVKAFGKD